MLLEKWFYPISPPHQWEEVKIERKKVIDLIADVIGKELDENKIKSECEYKKVIMFASPRKYYIYLGCLFLSWEFS